MSDFITNGELRIEAERLCDENERLTTENNKLRELARLLLYGATHDAEPAEGLVWSQKVNVLMRELGIEVEDGCQA